MCKEKKTNPVCPHCGNPHFAFYGKITYGFGGGAYRLANGEQEIMVNERKKTGPSVEESTILVQCASCDKELPDEIAKEVRANIMAQFASEIQREQQSNAFMSAIRRVID